MVTVLGGGVSGLTTAVTLRRAGFAANVIRADSPERTVSWVAAAIWTFPDLSGRPPERDWALRSREVFDELARTQDSGVRPLRHVELFRTDPGPTWWETTPHVHRSPAAPSGYEAAFDIDGFIVEPPIYLPWLERTLESLGGSIVHRRVESLEDIDGPIVNCTGLGSAMLVDDADLHPVRGQVVVVDASAVTTGIADESDLERIAYVYPRSSEVIVGGTREIGSDVIEPDRVTTERIIADAQQLDGRLRGATVVDVRVGLRPGRQRVRIEAEQRDGRLVIHNYGHGGQGYVLSWGCAQAVADLLGAGPA